MLPDNPLNPPTIPPISPVRKKTAIGQIPPKILPIKSLIGTSKNRSAYMARTIHNRKIAKKDTIKAVPGLEIFKKQTTKEINPIKYQGKKNSITKDIVMIRIKLFNKLGLLSIEYLSLFLLSLLI